LSVFVIGNPRAGAGAGRSVLRALEREPRSDVTLMTTERPGDGTSRAREALDRGAAGLVVVGGDGTLSEVAQAFFGPGGVRTANRAWIGLLLAGTGGDFARMIGAPRGGGARARLDALLDRGQTQEIDCGWMEARDEHADRPLGRAIVNVASFGLGGLVVRRVNASGKRLGGTASFLVATLRALAAHRPPSVRLTLDGHPLPPVRISNVALANGRFFGGGMQIAPGAELADGFLDCTVVPDAPLLGALRMVPDLYRGTLEARGMQVRKARVIEAEALDSEPVLVDADGEAGGRLPLRIEVRPGALQLRTIKNESPDRAFA
jgi:diacylglycerol kinase (ATP)